MSIWLKSFLMLAFFYSSFAEAKIDYTKDPVDPSKPLALVGKGMSPRHGDHLSLVYACSGENSNCDQIRAVVFNAAKKTANWVGPALNIIHEEGEEIESAIQKELKENAKNFHVFNRNGSKSYGKYFVGYMGLLTVASLINPVLAVPVVLVSGPILFLVHENKLQLGASLKFSQAFADQNGWNWTIDTKKIKTESFWDFYDFVEMGYPKVISETRTRQ
jgi:hypothetical protein